MRRKKNRVLKREIRLTESTLPIIQDMAEQMPGGFFIYRAGGKGELLFVNHAVLEIYGCQDEAEFQELTGNCFEGMVYPEDYAKTLDSIQAQISAHDRQFDYVEYRIARKDGKIRWVDDYGHFVHTEAFGDLYYVFVNDSTERHLVSEESAREREVIEGLSIDFSSIFLLDLDTGLMRAYRLHSEFSKEIMGGGMEDWDGQDTAWRGIFSRYAERYVLPEDRERYLGEISAERIRSRLHQESAYTVDYRCQKPGQTALAYMQMSIVRISGGQLYHHAVMGYRDVTEQTRKVQRELEDRLRIEEALERERRLNEAKSAFLFNISHDIRTPMNSIVGFTQLAHQHTDSPERLKDYLERVDVSSRHMMALIEDALEMNQLDSGQVRLQLAETDLGRELAAVVEMFRSQAEEKRIQLVYSPADGLSAYPAYTDAPRFRKIMANLLSNAIKFTPEGGVVRVSAREEADSRPDYACFSFRVEDSGIGMGEDFLKRIFHAFEREESSTKTGYLGTGLGLSIVKKLLDLMDGSIEVESEKGKGSVFTVRLPLKLAGSGDRGSGAEKGDTPKAGEILADAQAGKAEADPKAGEAEITPRTGKTEAEPQAGRTPGGTSIGMENGAAALGRPGDGKAEGSKGTGGAAARADTMAEAAPSAASVGHGALGKEAEATPEAEAAVFSETATPTALAEPETAAKRLLLVEDIEMNRLLAETILMEAGFEVESVPDGSDAVEAVKQHPPGYYQLILMDIQMPIMNGYEATRAIRALGRVDTAILPIVALSANAGDEDRRRSVESGMNAHIAKPFDVEKLIETVEGYVSQAVGNG